MSNQPRVLCVMLTRDREEMTRRAIASFRAQTYENKRLFILDSGVNPLQVQQEDGLYHETRDPYETHRLKVTIGTLRNIANAYSDPLCLDCEVIAHFDSDDVSHPNRIAEQVALLQSSGAPAVGYNDMLFWRSPRLVVRSKGPQGHTEIESIDNAPGEAWLYRNPNTRYALGTSLCYHRRTWEEKPFEDLPKNGEGTGEDSRFIQGLDVVGVSSFPCLHPAFDPRMVCSIHGGNTMAYDIEDATARGAREWTRVPEWDEHCRERMAL